MHHVSCNWYVEGHRCTHDAAENCKNDILVTNINHIRPSLRSRPDFCPRMIAIAKGSSEIIVPSEISKSIKVKVDNIATFLFIKRFVCQFKIEYRVISVNEQLL
jgi:hypothetical protein